MLAVIHWACDALFFLVARNGVQDYGLNHQIFLGALALYAVLTIPKAGAK